MQSKVSGAAVAIASQLKETMPMRILVTVCSVFALLSSSVQAGEPMLRRTMQHDGIEREYFVHIPEGAIIGEDELPLVVAVHGYTSTATGFEAAHGLRQHADQHHYIVVYPQGSHFSVAGSDAQEYRVTSWNDLAANQPATADGPHCSADSATYPCPPECSECSRCAWTSCYDDLGFLDKVLNAMQAEFPVDADRLYLLGVSNGGMMVLRAGCNLSDRFAAVAPIIGQLAPGYDCGPTTDLPMLHLYGGKDETVRFDGTAGEDDGFIYTSAADTAATWAQAMACETGPEPWQSELSTAAGLVCSAYSDCRVPGQQVVSCMDPEAEHWWPSQGYAGSSATCVTAEQFESLPGQQRCSPPEGRYEHLGMDLIWEFFARYRRASRTQ